MNDKETIASLKREIDYLRSKNEQMMTLMKKNNETAPTPATPTPTTPEIDINGNDILTKNVDDVDDEMNNRNISEVYFTTICVPGTRIRGNFTTNV